MKTIGKIKINPQNMLVKEELLRLQGGSGFCYCYTNDYQSLIGACITSNWNECDNVCWNDWHLIYSNIQIAWDEY